MKDIVILGSTGSIGTQTLDVVDHLQEEWNVTALSANSNIELLEEQITKYKPEYVVVADKNAGQKLKENIKDKFTKVYIGSEKLSDIASLPDVNLVINGIVGAAGLKPSLAALKEGHKLGLANKESLVVGGHLVNDYLEKYGGIILPVDSEHNAVFHLLDGVQESEIESILLTASGGPFFNKSKSEMAEVTVEEALDHPNWDMGSKITIDSATMMNKGLEVIEAHWLFNQPYDNINVVIHPESIIHSMVELKDNTVSAELGVPDMRTPIQSVLTYPLRKLGSAEKLNLFEIGQLNFHKPDLDKFPALNLAYQAGKMGGSMPVVLNAANEIAVDAFLNNKISFLQITEIIERIMDRHDYIQSPSFEEIMAADSWARNTAEEECKQC